MGAPPRSPTPAVGPLARADRRPPEVRPSRATAAPLPRRFVVGPAAALDPGAGTGLGGGRIEPSIGRMAGRLPIAVTAPPQDRAKGDGRGIAQRPEGEYFNGQLGQRHPDRAEREALDQESILGDEALPVDLKELDTAVELLSSVDAQAAASVKLRLLAGLMVEEAASCPGVSRRAAERDWTFADLAVRPPPTARLRVLSSFSGTLWRVPDANGA